MRPMIKNILTICGFALYALLVLLPAPLRAATTILHHDLQVRLFPGEARLEGRDALRLTVEGKEKVVFRLSPGARVERVVLEGRDIPFEFEQGSLRVSLPVAGGRSQIILRVDYQGRFQDAIPGQPVHSEDPSYGIAGTISPKGAFLSPAAGWYPDLPGGNATFRLRVEAPAGFEGITAGALVAEGRKDGQSYSVWQTARPLSGLTLAAGPYRMERDLYGDIPLLAYFYPENEHLAQTYLAAVKAYLEMYSELFGPYPYEKFAVAENFFPTGYGFPSWTLLGSSVVRLPFIVETSLGHEVAHSWWGNAVKVDYASGNWSEGLTTYVADHLYKERSSPEEALEYRRKILRDYTTLVDDESDFPLSSFTSRDSAASQAVGYGKAAMVFHMLRRLVGEAPYWEGLKRASAERLHQRVGWSELKEDFEATSGKSLKRFFRQWLERPGAPSLALRDVSFGRRDNAWLIEGSLVQTPPFYDLLVPVRVETTSGPLEGKIPSQKGSAPFILETPARPLRLVVDPDADLFRRLHPEESPPTVNAIRGAPALMAVVSIGLEKEALEGTKTLLAALRQEKALMLAEGQVDLRALKDHDLLYLGWPRNTILHPVLPEGLSIGKGNVTLFGTTYDDPGAALFVALPHPVNPERSAAIFIPLSGAAAGKAARKIPHYGKYSYLLFEDGTNRVKGTWPVTASPLIHEFSDREDSR